MLLVRGLRDGRPGRHGLGHRQIGGMRDGHLDGSEAVRVGYRRGAAAEEHLGPAAGVVHDLHVGPANAFCEACAEGLQYCLLRREAARHVLGRPRPGLAGGELSRGQNAGQASGPGCEPGDAADLD